MPKAKNRPLLSPFARMILRRSVWLLAALMAPAQLHAQQVDTPAPTTGSSAGTSTDRSTPAALSASERLAIQARQALEQVKAPPSPLWLDVDNAPVFGFWQSDMSGDQEGAVLMLHADGHSPLWPDSLLNLHRVLPRFGWATLSIELPPAAPPVVPARQDLPAMTSEATAQVEPLIDAAEEAITAEPDQQPVTEQQRPSSALTALAAEEVERIAVERIQAALDYLQKQNYHNIVIMGQGIGAARALKFASTTGAKNDAVRALVLLDYRPLDLTGYSPGELLGQIRLPVLDLITSVDFADRLDAAERRQLAKQAQVSAYQTRRIAPQAGVTRSDEETVLTKSVRGFISRDAPGRELE